MIALNRMSADPVISVQNVSKAYRIWDKPAARLTAPMQEALAGMLPGSTGRWFGNQASRSYRDFKALENVSFEIQRGEIIGIIGRNGSGKSTHLQIIAGTLQPTTGSVKVNGRLAALLELGSGFNQEFTGRENVYLNSTVLGLTRPEIDAKFDSVASFADIGEFIDQPVKTYSSGMAIRLAFAVQIQLEPDLLIVDEALSVGDEAFQRKCFARIGQMRDRGATILFVSHSSATVVALCQRAILLDHGRRILTARPKEALQFYNQLCYASAEARPQILAEIARADASPAPLAPTPALAALAAPPRELAATRPNAYFLEELRTETRSEFPPRGARILEVQIHDTENRGVNVLVPQETYTLRLRVAFEQSATRVRFGWTAKSLTGVVLSGAATHQAGQGFDGFDPGQEISVKFTFRNLFNPGTYFINVAVRALMEEPDVIIHGFADALMFKVLPSPGIARNGFMDCTVEPAWTATNAKSATPIR